VKAELLHIAALIGEICGFGLTVIVNSIYAPEQTPKLGVTLIVAVTADEPALLAVNEAIFPVPLNARPMEVVLFVQLYVVPPTAPEKLIAVVEEPLQKD
jgi:hypothetical protein